MDLDEYQTKIKNALLNSQWHKNDIENKIKGGSIPKQKYNKIPKPVYNDIGPSSYGDNPDNYKTTRDMYLKSTVKKRSPVHKKIPSEDSDEGYSDSDSDSDIEGGNFIKSMKKIGKSGSKMLVSGAKIVGTEGAKTLGREGAKSLISTAGKYLAPLATEALPITEEVAPLALMAAGMRRRKVTKRPVNMKEIDAKVKRSKMILAKLKR